MAATLLDRDLGLQCQPLKRPLWNGRVGQRTFER
jgi:hypothetical protein